MTTVEDGECTCANLSNEANRSLRISTSCAALIREDSAVKPMMSAKRMLQHGDDGTSHQRVGVVTDIF